MSRKEDRDRFHREIAERMAEPDYLRQLRRQDEKIESDRMASIQEAQWQSEADRLRERIRRAGHTPVCRVTLPYPQRSDD